MPECPACGEQLPEEPGPDAPIHVDGQTFEMQKLTYRERKAIKPIVRELVLLDDPSADPDKDWSEDDLRLAFAIVCARKSKPEFSVQDGLELTPAELAPPTGNVPPTQAASAAT